MVMQPQLAPLQELTDSGIGYTFVVEDSVATLEFSRHQYVIIYNSAVEAFLAICNVKEYLSPQGVAIIELKT